MSGPKIIPIGIQDENNCRGPKSIPIGIQDENNRRGPKIRRASGPRRVRTAAYGPLFLGSLVPSVPFKSKINLRFRMYPWIHPGGGLAGLICLLSNRFGTSQNMFFVAQSFRKQTVDFQAQNEFFMKKIMLTLMVF